MVAVDENRKPVAVPTLTPSTPDERRRWDAALMRKTLRKELAARFAEVRQTAGQ